MENIILGTLLKSDEYSINELCRSSSEIRNVCKTFKNRLAKHILENRILYVNQEILRNILPIDLKSVSKEYNGDYGKMLLDWKKWGRSKHIRIDDPDFDMFDMFDIKKANKILDKPENKILKKSLIRGDILSINYSIIEAKFPRNRPGTHGKRNKFKFIFDGKKLEELYRRDSRGDASVPKSYLVLDEFHIRYWDRTIADNTYVPVKLTDPIEITRSEGGNAVVFTFEKNKKTIYLFLYSQEPVIPIIIAWSRETSMDNPFKKVNYFETEPSENDIDGFKKEFPELKILDKFTNDNYLSAQVFNTRSFNGI